MALPNITQEINTIKSTYLPKSGGSITGSLTFLNNWGDNIGDIGGCVSSNNYRLRLTGGEYGWAESGGVIELFSRSNTGYVTIQAQDETNSSTINIAPNGAFTHNGNNVITSAGGTINGSLSVNGTIVSVNGNIEAPTGNIRGARFTADNHVNDNIDFMFRHITNGGMYLPGTYARNDEWYAITSLKGSYYGGANNYRLWSDGLIEQWGYVGGLSNGNVWITFPVAFTSTDYCLLTFARGRSAGSDFSIGSDTYYTTGITVSWDGHPNDPAYINWYAVGY